MTTTVFVRFYDTKESFTFQTMVDPYLDCFSRSVCVMRAVKDYCARNGIQFRNYESRFSVGE